MNTVNEKAKKIKLVIFDVDGVLTNGQLYFNEQGEVTLGFYIQDGLGIDLLHKAGIIPAIISGRRVGAIEKRAAQLNIHHVFLGIKDKDVVYRQLRDQLNLSDEQVAYVGDDWIDLRVLKQVGLKIAVANAVPEVKAIADWETPHEGGRGAVRDACELIIKSQNQFDALLNQYR